MGFSPRLLLTIALVALAILFGGGGSPSPMAELVVELGALAALVAWLVLPATEDGADRDRLLWASAAVAACVPLVQLIPLPPAIWHTLPGREQEIAAATLLGRLEHWRPLSVAPYRTLASALSLTAPIISMFLVSRLRLRDRTTVLATVVVLGLISGLVGVLQLLGNGWPHFYARSTVGFATGFQANRNAYADVLLVALLAGAALVAARPHLIRGAARLSLAGVAVVFLVLSILGSGSRTGSALIVPVAIAATVLLRRLWRPSRRAVIVGAVAVLAIGTIGTTVVLKSDLAQRTMARFDAGEDGDQRAKLWEDATFALRTTWPVGSGMGTFRPVFESVEQLKYVDASEPNRAHNDFLEFGIETGLAGIVLGLVFAMLVAGRIWRVMTSAQVEDRRSHALFTLFTLLVLGLHSIVDYPMRSMSLAVLFGVCMGLISNVRTRSGGMHVRP